MHPLISIVTITYNDLDGFSRTAASVIPQLSSSVEWIVKDGGSDSLILRQMNELLPSSGYVFRSSPDTSVYNAMNKALLLASGDWLVFMNGGDAFVSGNTVTRILEYIQALSLEPSGKFLIAGGTELISLTGKAAYRPSRLISQCKGVNSYRMAAFHQSQIYSRSVYQKQRFREGLKVSADHAFFWDAIIDNTRLICLDFPVSRFYAGGLSSKKRFRSCLDVGYSIFMIQGQKNLWGALAFCKRLLLSCILPRFKI